MSARRSSWGREYRAGTLGRAAGVTGVEQAYRAYREIGRSLTGGGRPGIVPTAVVAGVVQGTMLVRLPS